MCSALRVHAGGPEEISEQLCRQRAWLINLNHFVKGTAFFALRKLNEAKCFLAPLHWPPGATTRGFDDGDDYCTKACLVTTGWLYYLLGEVDIMFSMQVKKLVPSDGADKGLSQDSDQSVCLRSTSTISCPRPKVLFSDIPFDLQ